LKLAGLNLFWRAGLLQGPEPANRSSNKTERWGLHTTHNWNNAFATSAAARSYWDISDTSDVIQQFTTSLCIDRVTSISPCFESTQQRGRIFDSLFLEVDHRTGGRMFVWSRTIGDYQFVFGQRATLRQNVLELNPSGAGDVPGIKRLLASYVYSNSLTSCQQFFEFNGRDSSDTISMDRFRLADWGCGRYRGSRHRWTSVCVPRSPLT
jgi:hypothetical protein